eukprot:TRINITY_DN31763_c0_g1_i1.p1 TRINITY_DN31763_c0_g1~~TRINITY_DN31763_c0_g1_i1.p1  ORF type:complete len:351 (+),score=66.79 TRINITY_DN31763_c0_g1_i1:148-1200(+)
MGSYLSAPVTDKESSAGAHAQFPWAASSMQGWRKSQEDAHIACSLTPTVGLFAVFDGHGGAQVSQFASQTVPRLGDSVAMAEGDWELALVDAFRGVDQLLEQTSTQRQCGFRSPEEMNSPDTEQKAQQMQQLAALKRAMQGAKVTAGNGNGCTSTTGEPVGICRLRDHPVTSGCTAVVALLDQTRIVVANCGDSRAVLSRAGQAVPLSFDHKPSDACERARICKAGGFLTEANGHHRINGNLNLSRALGDLKYKQSAHLGWAEQMITSCPDLVEEALTSQDEFVIMACDGVWDLMSNQEAVDYVGSRLAEGVEPTLICEQLFDHCITQDPKMARGLGADNMTCIIVKLSQ